MSTRRGKMAPPLSDASNLKLGIVLSDYHERLAEDLLRGARSCLVSHGVPPESVEEIRVPGAFEIPQAVARLQAVSKPPLDAILTLGVLMRGDTLHFEVLSHEVCRSLGEIGRSSGVPVAFGVLTVDTEQQARERTGKGRSNKGWEAAEAAVRMALLFRQLEDRDAGQSGLSQPPGRRRSGR
ncbi:MAG: 6,7-dimethyl-8-ribityllumazine synthase [Acidobacteria bacterium]|nr:6,7-dimethyl-8-ribityllumazine synthase [Acidobacteriota bacterium]